MLKLSFKMNGRTIPASRIAEELTKQVQKSATEMVARRASSIRCPVHHQMARISPGFNGNLNVHGCCDQLIAEVRKQLQ
jgi:hypothetical protein